MQTWRGLDENYTEDRLGSRLVGGHHFDTLAQSFAMAVHACLHIRKCGKIVGTGGGKNMGARILAIYAMQSWKNLSIAHKEICAPASRELASNTCSARGISM